MSNEATNPSESSGFKEGDTYPALGKTIKVLIQSRGEDIVFLDSDCVVQYRLPPRDDDARQRAFVTSVISEVGLLETLSLPLRNSDSFQPFRRLLGDAVASTLSGDAASRLVAKKILERARIYLRDRMDERARVWLLSAAGWLSLAALLIGLAAWLGRTYLSAILGVEIADIVVGMCLGVVGAFMSLLSRSSSVRVAAGAGRQVHRVEALSRLAAGAIGALLVAIAVKANVFLGAINSMPHSPFLLLLVCLVSGASERLVPGIIERVERAGSGAPTKKK